jgi:hypothetical protein
MGFADAKPSLKRKAIARKGRDATRRERVFLGSSRDRFLGKRAMPLRKTLKAADDLLRDVLPRLANARAGGSTLPRQVFS